MSINLVSTPQYEQICPRTPTREELRTQIRRTILATLVLPPPSVNQVWHATVQSYHQILEGLFLGNSISFIGTLLLEESEYLAYRNLVDFSTVITACPQEDIAVDCPPLQGKELSRLMDPNIAWLHIGKSTFDHPEYWASLVYDCTYPNSEWAQFVLPKGHTYTEEHKRMNQQKREALQKIPVRDWFAPIFEEIDKAVFERKMVLVHCRAGISRSASILAAYLISRFSMTPENAIAFLQRKRACVNPQFIRALEDYDRLLHHSSASLPPGAAVPVLTWLFPGWED